MLNSVVHQSMHVVNAANI